MPNPKFILYCGTPLKKVRAYPSYRQAALAGQIDAGPGQFLVDTGDYVPSRSEQLLEENPQPIAKQPRSKIARYADLTSSD